MQYLVSVRCNTFNHTQYIEETFHGFCSQQTDFPFVCVIIDDASTDGEQDTIAAFINQHFDISKQEEHENFSMTLAHHTENTNCFFAIYYLKYNHSNIRKSKESYIQWLTSKYIALCEGDDYWTDPQKLQRQVDFLETHPDYTMVCCRARRYSERRQRFVSDSHCYDGTRNVDTDDIILQGGLFISTCSIVYRRSMLDAYPDYAARCHVGDYPLQILCAMRGKVHYMDEPMCVYRIENNTSWMGRQNGCVTAAKVRGYVSEVEMLKGFATDHPAYAHVFERRIRRYILWVVPLRKSDPEGEKRVREAFADDIRRFPPMVRLLLWMAVRNKTLRRWQRSWGRRLGIA